MSCSYCGGSFDQRVVPWEVNYDIKKLASIMNNDPYPVVVFYGGEPLLNPGFIEEAMNTLPAKRWGIQTNGSLVHALEEEYWRRFDVALVSIDGRERVTDAHRGKGSYIKAVEALRVIKGYGVNRVIARMTTTRLTEIYDDVMHLLSLGFDYAHWQINAVWAKSWDIGDWGRKSYIPGIRMLVNEFVKNAEKGKILGIVPFLGILTAAMFKPFSGVPCGSGHRSVSVTPDGRVLACPIAVYEKWAVLGNVESGFRLMEPQIPEMCSGCEYFRYCGGRCLYAQMEGKGLWKDELINELDLITKETIRSVLSIEGRIRELLNAGVISSDQIMYDPVLDSTEIIP